MRLQEDHLDSLRKLKQLPTLPLVIMRLLETVEDPTSSVEDFSRIIRRDAPLTANLLKLANSSYYGRSRQISTITEAIVLAGVDTLKAFALGTCVFQINPTTEEGKIYLNEIWAHALKVALASKLVARKLDVDNYETIYIGGLLHDIGKLIYVKFYSMDLVEITKRVKETQATFYDIEKLLYPLTHTELGMHLAEHWNLPGLIKTIIAMHHCEQEEIPREFSQFVGMVKVGNEIARISFNDPFDPSNLPHVDRNLLDGLSLTDDDYIVFCQKIYAEKDRVNSFFGLI